MLPESEKISRRQYIAVLFVALLSQHIRRVPRDLAATAGRAAWLAPLAAAPLVLLYLLFLRAFLGKQPRDHGLCGLFADALGGFFGRVTVFLVSLWLVFYGGFLLRNTAERFVSTVYPYSAPGVFVLAMGLLCLLAGLGRFRAIARSAMVFRPLLTAIILAMLLISLGSVDTDMLLPVTPADAAPVAASALKVVNVMGILAYLCFLEDHSWEGVRLRDYLPWVGVLLLISVLLCVCCIGMYGAELTAKATLPVFLLARDLKLFGSAERVEPLIITIWVLSDFVLSSTVLFIAARNLRWCFGVAETPEARGLGGGRWLSLLCVAAATAVGLTVGGDIVSMDFLSERLIPALNMAVIAGVLPLTFLIGRLRRTI